MASDTPPIQWYPGHIAKLERELQQLLKLLDVVIELRDARMPQATTYTALTQRLRQQKPVLLVLNKADLADPAWTQSWVSFLKKTYPAVIPFDSSSGKGKNALLEALFRLGEPIIKRQEAKGLKRRPLRTGVVGLPNVGKSTLINTLVGQKKAKTGHRAGVTRTTQWVRIHPMVELLDTPGLIPPRLDNPETGRLLATAYSIGDAAFDEEAVVPFFLELINTFYPKRLATMLDLPPEEVPTMETIARRRGYLMHGGEPDYKRTAQAILKDYRHGKLGRLTLERPPE